MLTKHLSQQDKQVLRAFTKELSNLKGLSHRHLVKLAGSYTDRKFVAIIMLPVADMNLQTFLEKADLDDTSRSFLRPFFGCLTSALSYLHDNRIRHKDIKPSNVLIKHDQVYLTDFGTSLDWSGCDNSTTVTAPPTTPRYCAPEVMAFVERNTSSDIWSLGCVFLEMWTVLKRYTLDELKAHMSANGTHITEYHHNLEAIASWIQMLKNAAGPSCDLAPSNWVQNMLQHKPRSRWNCHVLANQIQEASIDPSSEYAFKGLCCLEPDDNTTDDTESSDGCSQAEAITKSLPTVAQIHSRQIGGSAASDRPQVRSLLGTEAVSSASLSSLAQPDAPIPRILVNDCSVSPGAFVEEESESLARELYDPSVPTQATDDSEDTYPEDDDIMYSTTVSNFSGSDDETLKDKGTDKAPPPIPPTSSSPGAIATSKDLLRGSSSLDQDEFLKGLMIPCTLCDSLLSVAADAVKLPCHDWIHKGCYARGYRCIYTTCPICVSTNRRPASQANRDKRVKGLDRALISPGRAPIMTPHSVTFADDGGFRAPNPRRQISPVGIRRPRLSSEPSSQTTIRPADSGAEIPRTRKKRTVRPMTGSDPDLISQEHGAHIGERPKKREPRGENTDAKAMFKNDRSKFTPMQTFLGAQRLWNRSRKKAEKQDGALPTKRDAARERTGRISIEGYSSSEEPHHVDSQSSGDEKRRYRAASYKARTELDAQRKAEERRRYEFNRYAGTTHGAKSIKRTEAKERPVASTDKDPPPQSRPNSVEPPATKISGIPRLSQHPTYHTIKREPSIEPQYESYPSNGDNERGRARAVPSNHPARYGPEDVRWAPRANEEDYSEPYSYVRRYGPEDVRWDPKNDESVRGYPPKPHLQRSATFVY
jgi:serine/threonine protein kinase